MSPKATAIFWSVAIILTATACAIWSFIEYH